MRPQKVLSPAQKVEAYILRPVVFIGLITITLSVLLLRHRISSMPDFATQVLVPPDPERNLDSTSTPPMSTNYPAPYVHEPKEKHENTIILLHGTSQDGNGFGEAFLNFNIPVSIRAPLSPATNTNTNSSPPPSTSLTKAQTRTMPEIFPRTKFVFPTGRKRWSTVLGGENHAWFDFQSFSDRTLNETTQIPGLAESSIYLGQLVDSEVELLSHQTPGSPSVRSGNEPRGRENERLEEKHRKQEARRKIVIGGFSQGSAMAAISLLAGTLGGFEGSQIGGFVGMSGWCPFRLQILDAIRDAISHSSSDTQSIPDRKFMAAMFYLRGLLGMNVINKEQNIPLQRVPVFLGHGESDQKMKLRWGREMSDLLGQMSFDVKFKSYEGLEHWWGEDEMADLVEFLKGV